MALRKSETLKAIADKAVDAADNTGSQALPKGTGSSTLDALQTLGTSRLESRMGVLRGGFLFRLYRYIPYPLLMVMPFVREDTKRLFQALKRQKTPSQSERETEITPTSSLPHGPTLPLPHSPYAKYR
ncbi:MAG: hypothetical protein AAFY20_27240, partial [Cyanobacteria bacterium J06639_14]